MAEFAELVMRFVSGPDYSPITLKALSRRLKIEVDDYADFRAAVKALIKEGRIDLGRDKTLRKPDHSDAIVGFFKRSSRGFGFVRPKSGEGRHDQIYIAPEDAGDASSGDEVAVKVTKKPKRPGMNVEGRVIQIISRASALFVGTYFELAGAGYVKIDGTTFHDPVHVGDPGAKGAKPGDKVALEIVRYPTPYEEGEGVITELLGQRGAPGVDTLSVIRSYNIPDVFDAAALEEAREQARLFSEDEIGRRRDLREVLTITIDPATARDFDDAISLSRDERGFWSLGVHIADVSHFVRPSGALDREARLRGTSVYLPDRVIPMLPEVLSNSLASLQAHKTRYTMSALLEFDPEGIPTSRGFARSAIWVDHRFTYEQAMHVMSHPDDSHEGVAPEVVRMLSGMRELAMILRRRRYARGSLEMNLPEIQIELGDVGQVVGARLAEHDESHQVIEEFMLAANEAVAAHLTEHHAPFLHRVHPNPEERKLEQFAEFARSLGLKLDLPQSRFELQRILRETAGKPEEYAVHFGMLRSMKQAIYTPEHEGHYALASEDYCHFTSPIRRYPDLQVHRQLAALLEGKKPGANLDELFVLGENCTRTERRAEAAERELIRIKLLAHLADRIGQEFHAIVVGVEDFGVFCRLVELPVEGLVHVTSLTDERYDFEPQTHSLIGRSSGRSHRLGDRILVRIAHVDVDRRELDLVLADMPLDRPHRSRALGPARTSPSARPARASSSPTEKDSRKHKRKPKGRKSGGKKKKRSSR